MKIEQYQLESYRTLLILNDEDLNRQHMLLGVISEIGEITDAYKKSLAYGKDFDRVNLIEEACGDVNWYLCNWATLNNIILEQPTINKSFLNERINTPIDTLLDFLTKGLHFGNIQQTLNKWYTVCTLLGITDEEYDKGLQNNIDKLKIRYPEKFTNENALNRDLDSERVELEK